jgi:Uroporphyrinogen decarboxylase (URO-D)
MRQAGRSLPEYRALREKHGFFEIGETPELCAEVTLQPVRRHGVDAAVLFADIMSPVLGMGVDVELVEGVGPVVEERIDSAAAVERLRVAEPDEWAAPILQAVRIVRGELEPERALVGFCGGPFTVAGYLVEGRPSRDFVRTKTLMYREPETWHALMERLTEQFSRYVAAQAAAGVDTIQLFDSWVGVLSVADYREFVAPYSARVLEADDPFRNRCDHRAARRDGCGGRERGGRRLADPARRRLDRRRGGAGDSGQPRAGGSPRAVGAGGVGGTRRPAQGGRPGRPRLQPRSRRPPADRPGRAHAARGARP